MDLSGKHVALVDDVLTTGSSMGALAGALKKRGQTRSAHGWWQEVCLMTIDLK